MFWGSAPLLGRMRSELMNRFFVYKEIRRNAVLEKEWRATVTAEIPNSVVGVTSCACVLK